MGAKLVAKTEPKLTGDPKPLDRGTWNRTKSLVDLEVIHRDWGCALYSLHRLGRINNDQRDAGDRYVTLILDFRKLWYDPIGFEISFPGQEREYDVRCAETQPVVHAMGLAHAESMRDESEFETKRAKRLSKRYREARSLVGVVNRDLEDMLIDNTFPPWWLHKEIGHALTRLSHFFATGTKRKPKI